MFCMESIAMYTLTSSPLYGKAMAIMDYVKLEM
jgi:hypothetical protein